MGVRGLMTYCRRIQRPVKSRKGLRIGIDAFSLIFLFREKRKEFADFLESLKKNHSDITFVMDKRAQKEKKETVNERKDIRHTAKIQATGWKPQLTIEQGIIRTLRWLEANRWVYEARK